MSVRVSHTAHPVGCPCCRRQSDAGAPVPPPLAAMKRAGGSVRARVWERQVERAAEKAAQTPPLAPALDTLGCLASPLTGGASAAAAPALAKRARGKYFSQHLALALVDVENRRIARGKVPPAGRGRNMLAAYWRTYHCGSELRNEQGKLVTTLCRCRWCTVCSKIETARLINAYRPIIETWAGRHFVTLTAPAVGGDGLREAIRHRKKVFATIARQRSQQFRRGRAAGPLKCLRKLETTYNDVRNWYHPHFHVITSTEEEAEMLVREWLRHFPDANPEAQKITACDEGTLLELFKYFAKLTADSSKANSTDLTHINAEALNVIFHAVAGVRTFESYGCSPVTEDEGAGPDEELNEITLDRGERWLWNRAATDWVEVRTGEFLTNYVPSDGLRDLVERRILRGRPRRGPTRPAAPPNGAEIP